MSLLLFSFKSHSIKARFKYPIYPNIGGKKPISKAPQVVSVKYKPSNKKPTNSELQKQYN